jgi:hypothetical protein
MVEHLPSKHEALSSRPSTTKKRGILNTWYCTTHQPDIVSRTDRQRTADSVSRCTAQLDCLLDMNPSELSESLNIVSPYLAASNLEAALPRASFVP